MSWPPYNLVIEEAAPVEVGYGWLFDRGNYGWGLHMESEGRTSTGSPIFRPKLFPSRKDAERALSKSYESEEKPSVVKVEVYTPTQASGNRWTYVVKVEKEDG